MKPIETIMRTAPVIPVLVIDAVEHAVPVARALVAGGLRVLEVGTGSGYQAAVLSRLAREVISIERYRTLADAARARLKTLAYNNVEVISGDGFAGEPSRAPFDRIIVTAAAESVPQALTDQLAEDGIMVIPLGPPEGHQELARLTKTKGGWLQRDNLIPVRFVPLLPGKAREL